MPWARIDDDYLGNHKLKDLTTEAIALDLAGIIFSAHNVRDGVLRRDDVRATAAAIHLKRWERPAAELVTAGRWTVEGDGYAIHDYLKYQPAREKVLAERAAAAERKAKQRHKDVPPGLRPDSAPESGAPRTRYPDPSVPNGTLRAPPNPPRRARGAKRALSDRDRDELLRAEARARPLEVVP